MNNPINFGKGSTNGQDGEFSHLGFLSFVIFYINIVFHIVV